MRAIQLEKYGGPEVLKMVELEVPAPAAKEVLIKIEAIGVNYADTARREGQYVIDTPLPFVPGAEVAGTVVEIGSDASRFKKGDKVVTLLGSSRSTGYAEFTVADEKGLIPIPEGVDVKQAVSLPLQGLSAYHILKTMGRIEQGETVLIHAAAGGVGTIAVQLAKLFGASIVIATASTPEKRSLALEMGADAAVDYTQEGWEKEVLQLTGGKGVDVALEMAGGDVFRKTLSCMAPFGRLVIYGVASGEQSRLYPSSLMAQNLSVIGFFLPQIMRKKELYLQSLSELLAFLQNGDIKLTIGGVYPLESAKEVHQMLQGRQTKGKLILVP
ncbi:MULTISPECIES: quinone oxidoreductase family protein [Bacillaceae]|uniref:quinone oxidoreductase family protein n=1 Tax=Bacillaceae TaxID=186817 RepID=UPI000C76C825|nr:MULTISPECIES: quinone oxidoreductase [Bacillaceae]PLR69585.1 alcohol dehydrogenase [Bacillus sp. UMB0893]QNG58941.1 quinone oxidoreductase [Bacillus sp. PAMC26568]